MHDWLEISIVRIWYSIYFASVKTDKMITF